MKFFESRHFSSLFVCFAVLAILVGGTPVLANAQTSRDIRLVLQITVDGLRADLLNRIGITREAIERPVVKTKSSKATKKTTKKKRAPRRKKTG